MQAAKGYPLLKGNTKGSKGKLRYASSKAIDRFRILKFVGIKVGKQTFFWVNRLVLMRAIIDRY